MCTDFEGAIGFFLPHDHVSNKRGTKQGAIFSGTTGNPKPGTGRTGVALRCHKYPEFNKITDVHKDELRSWQEDNNITGPLRGNSKGPRRTTLILFISRNKCNSFATRLELSSVYLKS